MSDLSTRGGWRFSLRDLLIAFFCLGVLFMLLAPAVNAARDAARRSQCISNLKHLGLAVHNFHDTYNGLPPLSIGEGRGSFFVVLEPFLETNDLLFHGANRGQNTAVYELMEGKQGTWAKLTPQEQARAASRNVLHCPSRQRPKDSRVTPADGTYFGPTGDYAVVFFDGRQDYDSPEFQNRMYSSKAWQDHYDPCDSLHVGRQRGVLRLAHVECGGDEPEWDQWRPRDTFARVTDGTSTTFLVGEKHLRQRELNRYDADPEHRDGTWLFEARGPRATTIARNMWFPIANGPNDQRFARGMKADPEQDFSFGSSHYGVVQFLRGDGSVSAIDVNLDRGILYKYAHCQDGLCICDDEPAPGAENDASDDHPTRPPYIEPKRQPAE